MCFPSIQSAASYIYHPICREVLQIVPENWKEKTMLMGLILSVCCAVVTFFTQTAFIWVAFSTLSGVCGLGALYMHQYENCKKIQEQLETLQKENQTFNTHNQTLSLEKEKLQSEITRLAIHADHLTQANQELTHSVKDLHVHLVTLKPITEGSQEIEKKLNVFSEKMDEQRQVSQGLMELLSKIEQSDPLACKKELLNQLQSLQNDDTILQKLRELGATQEQLLSTQEQLLSVQERLSGTLTEHADVQRITQVSDQLSSTQEQYDLSLTHLREERQQCELSLTHLQKERQKLSTVLSELKETQAAFATLVIPLENIAKINL